MTLLDYGRFNSVIDPTYFPATVASSYWSSTTYTPSSTSAWAVPFINGFLNYPGKTSGAYVRCVSGHFKEYSSNFTDNTDGTVKDNTTGLFWQKCISGQTNSDCSGGSATAYSWQNGINYCNSLNNLPTSNPRVWRVPNINELLSLIDVSKSSGPLTDTTKFTNFPTSTVYASSTTNINSTNQFHYIGFDFGYSQVVSKIFGTRFFRCVSGP